MLYIKIKFRSYKFPKKENKLVVGDRTLESLLSRALISWPRDRSILVLMRPRVRMPVRMEWSTCGAFPLLSELTGNTVPCIGQGRPFQWKLLSKLIYKPLKWNLPKYRYICNCNSMEYTVSLRKLNEVHCHQYSAIYLCTPNFSLYYPSHRYLSQVLYGNTDSTCASSPCCKKLRIINY
jgi:hypothetical protein